MTFEHHNLDDHGFYEKSNFFHFTSQPVFVAG